MVAFSSREKARGTRFFYQKKNETLSLNNTIMTLEKNLFTMNISPHSGNIFDLGADSYKVGADRLVTVLMKNPATNEMLISTVVHLYRQFLEYKLKETIRFMNIAIYNKDEMPTHHRLEISFVFS